MAANLDRAETSLTAVSDIAYIRGIDGSGNSVRISKADLASVLGGIGKSTGTGTGSNSGLAQTVASGYLNGHNHPISYGTIIRFPGYYNVYMCISHNGSELWITGDAGSGDMDNLIWHKVSYNE